MLTRSSIVSFVIQLITSQSVAQIEKFSELSNINVKLISKTATPLLILFLPERDVNENLPVYFDGRFFSQHFRAQ